MSRLEAVGRRWNAARVKERALAAELYEAIREAVAGGMSEVEAAKVAGVDRMTVRRALGKR
jgi:DNA invertase Pin-like site-specific DNA recombinase